VTHQHSLGHFGSSRHS